jgi:4-amino-4-deoxy-L-arabinose transferase-like glycosyltransferase
MIVPQVLWLLLSQRKVKKLKHTSLFNKLFSNILTYKFAGLFCSYLNEKMRRIKLTNTAILILIIVVASALRLYKLFEIPFTQDEFSALFRTHFNSFSELIEKGVKTDGHPAGIQVFLYYWTKLFGYSEWIVKLPFIISGILSVLLIYLIAKDWYNETVALISASFLASIEYSIVYSQIARPYTSGLMFSLLMVLFWTKIILFPQKRFYTNSVFFIIAASLCTYNHHFSLLFTAIVGISGLFYIQRQYLLKYAICGILIFILYIPHINIFLYQLNVGGVGGWLGKPHNNYFLDYIYYIFNYSLVSIALAISLVLFSLLKIKRGDVNFRYLALFACWFALPLLIGFFYSKFISSVLNNSVLIFSFPFLLFVLFGQIKPMKTSINLLIVLTILSANIYALINERHYYTIFYNSPYQQILVDQQKAVKSYPDMVSIIDSHEKISQYYIKKFHYDSSFLWYNSFPSQKDLIAYLEKQSQTSKYLFFGCLSYNDPLTVPIIQDYYPTIKLQKNYGGGTTYIFSRENPKESNIIDCEDFESEEKKHWSSIEKNKFVDTICFSGKRAYFIDSKTEWSPMYTRPLDEIMKNKNNFIDISVQVYLTDQSDDIILIASLESKGKNVYWGGSPLDNFVTNNQSKNGRWISIHHSIKLSDAYLNYRDIQLNAYIWNKGKHNFVIDDFTIKLRTGNPVIYGLGEKF